MLHFINANIILTERTEKKKERKKERNTENGSLDCF